jgi:hypothetical protein
MSTVLPPLSLDEVTQSAEDPFAALNAILNSYNTAEMGPPRHLPLWLFARDPAGKVHGGADKPIGRGAGSTCWPWRNRTAA